MRVGVGDADVAVGELVGDGGKDCAEFGMVGVAEGMLHSVPFEVAGRLAVML